MPLDVDSRRSTGALQVPWRGRRRRPWPSTRAAAAGHRAHAEHSCEWRDERRCGREERNPDGRPEEQPAPDGRARRPRALPAPATSPVRSAAKSRSPRTGRSSPSRWQPPFPFPMWR